MEIRMRLSNKDVKDIIRQHLYQTFPTLNAEAIEVSLPYGVYRCDDDAAFNVTAQTKGN